jgi:hypothetical protein
VNAHHRFKGEEINELLRQRAVSLCSSLGLDGVRDGNNYWVKDPRDPRGGKIGNFSVELSRGIYANWADPLQEERGDLINLIAVMQFGGDNGKAIKWALNWLGLADDSIAPSPREAAALAKARREQDDRERAREAGHRATARAIWLAAKPLDGTDPASHYLLNRGIDVLKLKDGPPRALRWAPDCLAMPEDVRIPAMLANISARGGMIACHRTYLDGTAGAWVKAFRNQTRDGHPVSAKRVLGKYAGGSIRLTKGASGKSLAEAPKGEWIVIAEGIENALSAALVRPDLRCLAAVALGNIANVELPEDRIGGVYIVADNDKKPNAAQALDRAMDRYAARGIEPVIVRANADYKDFNDWQNDKRE